jgi:hypothetical protein
MPSDIRSFAQPSTFEIFRDRIGHWCARRADGMVFGTFFEREAAIKFARRESHDGASPRLLA